MDGRARVVPKAVANGTTSARVEIKRSAMVGQAGRHRRPAWARKDEGRMDETPGGAGGLYTSRKRRDGRSAALYPDGSR